MLVAADCEHESGTDRILTTKCTQPTFCSMSLSWSTLVGQWTNHLPWCASGAGGGLTLYQWKNVCGCAHHLWVDYLCIYSGNGFYTHIQWTLFKEKDLTKKTADYKTLLLYLCIWTCLSVVHKKNGLEMCKLLKVFLSDVCDWRLIIHKEAEHYGWYKLICTKQHNERNY